MGAHPWMLWHVLTPATFAQAPEGRAVGVVMLAPLVLFPALGVALAARVLRDGIRAEHALLGALLAFAAATLAQAYQPMLLLRLLQSAVPFYLLATIAGFQACVWLRAREHRVAARFALAAPFAAGAAHVALVIFGIPALRQPIYTGSIRARAAYQYPVEVLGETFYEEWGITEQIRLVRAFYAEHVGADEPTMALPVHALYNAVLERKNPTRYLHDHPSGDFIMTAAQKRGEVERLLASPLRFAIVDQRWYAAPTEPDALLAALREHFHPVRGYGTVLVLERGNDAAWRRFAAELRSAIARGPAAFDARELERFADEHPGEPLAWRMLGLVRQAAGDPAGAIEAFEHTVALDPADVAPLETVATLRAQQGQRAAALDAVRRARATRDSATLRKIEAALGTR
jgi:tetratricopeptide (TPR) repeat protein